jgi:hypothetical protein
MRKDVERREALLAIVAEQYPMTVRQVVYQATVRGLIEKTDSGYKKIELPSGHDARSSDSRILSVIQKRHLGFASPPGSFDALLLESGYQVLTCWGAPSYAGGRNP